MKAMLRCSVVRGLYGPDLMRDEVNIIASRWYHIHGLDQKEVLIKWEAVSQNRLLKE